jgi:hypothetical protein
LRWENIYKYIEKENHIFLLINLYSAIIIPKDKIISKESKEKVVEFIKNRAEENKAKKEVF